MKIILLLVMILFPLNITQQIQSSIPQTQLYTTPENVLIKLSQEYDIPLNLIHAIWKQESNKTVRSKRGKAGEYGPFQILEIAAKQVSCQGAWRSTFPKNAECGIKYMKYGVNKCGSFYLHRVATFYNTGKCRKKPNGYSQEVMKRILKAII